MRGSRNHDKVWKVMNKLVSLLTPFPAHLIFLLVNDAMEKKIPAEPPLGRGGGGVILVCFHKDLYRFPI